MATGEVRGYGTVARLFHWITAALVAVMIPAGIAMTSEGFESVRDSLYILHKGTGSLLLVIVLVRFLWKIVLEGERPLPSRVPRMQRRMAAWTHWGLYALLLTMTLSGYVRTVGAGFPIELLDALGVPPLMGERPGLAATAAVVHKAGAYTITAVIALHIGAAMYHALIERDGVMGRMWPPWAGAGPSGVQRPGEEGPAPGGGEPGNSRTARPASEDPAPEGPAPEGPAPEGSAPEGR